MEFTPARLWPRRPLADGVRAAAVLSVVAAMVWWGPVELAVFLLALLGTVLPQLVKVSQYADAAHGILVLLAAWSSVLGLYQAISWWDLALHFGLTGAITGYLTLICVQWRAPARSGANENFESHLKARSAVVFAIAVGSLLALIWELLEWLGHTFIDSDINVGSTDTLGDLGAGLLGALTIGIFMTAKSTANGPDLTSEVRKPR